MDRRAFFGLMLIETMLAFGSTFAASFNIIYMFNELEVDLWYGPMYLLIGFGISALASLWMSWRPHLDPRNAIMFGLFWLCIEYSLFLVVHDGWLLGSCTTGGSWESSSAWRSASTTRSSGRP